MGKAPVDLDHQATPSERDPALEAAWEKEFARIPAILSQMNEDGKEGSELRASVEKDVLQHQDRVMFAVKARRTTMMGEMEKLVHDAVTYFHRPELRPAEPSKIEPIGPEVDDEAGKREAA